MKTLDVLYTPADFAALGRCNLDDTWCVVFDVFRASTSMVVALANGARAVVPVSEISEALEYRRRDPGVILAGERDGVRIRAELTGGVEFDLGNSPREFTKENIGGRTVVMTTTNGTRALRACAHAQGVLVASFVNLKATARFVAGKRPEHLLLVCSGTFNQAAYEDVLGAGALCDLIWDDWSGAAISDSTLMARALYRAVWDRLPEAAAGSRNGRRLSSVPDLREDVRFCLQRDVCEFAVTLRRDGSLQPAQETELRG
jgi:2-phosphosulfolactate phosphatase